MPGPFATDVDRESAPPSPPAPAEATLAPAEQFPAEGMVPVAGVLTGDGPVAGVGVAGAPPVVRRLAADGDPLGGTPAPGPVVDALRRSAHQGKPLETGLAQEFGAALGADLSAVRVHADGPADELSRSMQATAFTAGSDIYFTRGSDAPSTGSGRRLLAHELAHVAQGHSGASGGGTTIGRADDPVEREADLIADRAMSSLRRAHDPSVAPSTTGIPTEWGTVRRARGKPDEPTKVKLSKKISHALNPPGTVHPPVEISEIDVQTYLFGDGKDISARVKQVEKVLDLRGFGQKLLSKSSSVAELRIQTVKYMLLAAIVTGRKTVGEAAELSDVLHKSLNAPSYDKLAPAARTALASIGYTPGFEAIEVTRSASNDVSIVAEAVRNLSNFLSEEESLSSQERGTEIPNFRERVPDLSRSTAGMQVAQINRMRERIMWIYAERPRLGAPPRNFPAALDEDSPMTDWNRAVEAYRDIVSELRVRSNAILANGSPAQQTKATSRGDLISGLGGEAEQRGERYHPERVPLGLRQARGRKTEKGTGVELAPGGPSNDDDANNLHKEQLARVRAEMRDMLAREVPAFLVQKFASEMVDLILKEVHLEAVAEMESRGWGPPPGDYAFLALGSGGRHEATSFSDMDYAMVIDKTGTSISVGDTKRTSKEYFQELGKIMVRKIHGIGERGGKQVQGQPKGLRICEGGVFPGASGQNDWSKDVLIGTADDLAKIQRKPGFVTMGSVEFELGMDAEIFDATREPRFAFGSDKGHELSQGYSERLQSALKEEGSGGQSRAEEAGRVTLQDALKMTPPSPADLVGEMLDIKKVLYRPIQLIVKGMTLIAGVTAVNSRQRVTDLVKAGTLAEGLGQKVLDALEVIARIRLSSHLDSGEQQDEVGYSPIRPDSPDAGRMFLSRRDQQAVNAILTDVIPALQAAARAVLGQPQPAPALVGRG